jgi:hypothetical protein
VTRDELRALYERRLSAAKAEAERHGRTSTRVSNLRGISFAVAAGAALAVLLGKSLEVVGIVGGLGLLFFVGFVVYHARVIQELSAAERRAALNQDALLRVTGRFRELPQDGRRFADANHPFADDLDVFGPASLYQRISVAHTRFGEEALARFLKEPPPLDAILLRQEAVNELTPLLDLRQELESLSFAIVETPNKDKVQRRAVPDPTPLLAWLELKQGIKADAVVRIGSKVALCVTLAGLALMSAGKGPLLFLFGLAVHLLLLFRASAHTRSALQASGELEGAFDRYGRMLELVEGLTLKSRLIGDIKARLRAAGRPPSVAMAELARIAGFANLRHNGLVYPIINLLTLWDIHVTLALEGFRERTRGVLGDWFQVLGELEALSSLAGLAHDEPDFHLAEIAEGGPCFVAEGLSHPLVQAERRVLNDVSLEEAGTALLVTGSNMSGKSTLLRSMGLSVVLAFAGGPSCVRRLRLRPQRLATSIRVSDSLESGVSHFYAEVRKLKAVVNAAGSSDSVLFLLDEILHGTNSRERQVGARWVLAELLKRGAVGAVSTHDEELCRLTPELMTRVRLVHFRETVQNDEMTFDYVLREGPVKAGNALRVMRLAGLDVPLE